MAGLTIDDPVSLKRCLESGNVIPGDTIQLRGGTYTGDFISPLNGTAALPITIMSYPGEVAAIDGSLMVDGTYTTWKNLIGLYSGWTKRDTNDPDAVDMPTDKLWQIDGDHTDIINCILHDLAGGIYSAEPHGCNWYGNIIYNIGWTGPLPPASRGHGHCFYTHNSGTKITIKDNITFQPFATCIKVWGTNGTAKDYDVIGNIAFQGGVLYGNTAEGAHVNWNLLFGSNNTTGSNFLAQYNMTYHTMNEGIFATSNLAQGAGIVSGSYFNNYLAGRYSEQVDNCVTPIITGNVFVGGSDLVSYSNNTFLNWGSATETYFVRPNDYLNTRAHVAIYNWSGTATITVDLTGVTGLSIGDQVTFANVQDLFVDIHTGTLNANKCVDIDMRAISHSVAAPTLWTSPTGTFPTFGCFLVKKV